MNQTAEQLAPTPVSNTKLVGIGGWLLLLIVKLWIGVAVRLLAGMAEQNHAVALLNFAFAVFAAIAAYLLGRKRPKGVLFAKILLAAEAVYYILELLMPSADANSFKTAGFLVASVLYLIYLFRSTRIKNTYFGESLPNGSTAAIAESGIIGQEKARNVMKNGSKGTAIALFLIALLLWVATIVHNTIGFVAPVSSEAVGFDLWTTMMWIVFLYSSRNLYRSFSKKAAAKNQS